MLHETRRLAFTIGVDSYWRSSSAVHLTRILT